MSNIPETSPSIPVIVSPEVEHRLSLDTARIQVSPSGLRAAAVAVRASMPERVVVVHRSELDPLQHHTSFPVESGNPDGPQIGVRRHISRYLSPTSVWEGSIGHVVHSPDEADPRENDLVVVAQSGYLTPMDLTRATLMGLRNHPYLNDVARNDERRRARLDRIAVLGGGLGSLAFVGGSVSEALGWGVTSEMFGSGTALFVGVASTVLYTRNTAPRRAPMPSSNERLAHPLEIVSTTTGESIYYGVW